jgi:hypothetical protein
MQWETDTTGSQIAQNSLELKVHCARVGQGSNPLVLVWGECFLASKLSIWIENFMLFQHVVVASSYPSFF